MRIVAVKDIVAPISSAIANAYIDFSAMTASVVAWSPTGWWTASRSSASGFNSNGRYAAQGLLRRAVHRASHRRQAREPARCGPA